MSKNRSEGKIDFFFQNEWKPKPEKICGMLTEHFLVGNLQF